MKICGHIWEVIKDHWDVRQDDINWLLAFQKIVFYLM